MSMRVKKRRMTKFKKDVTMSHVTGLAETDNWEAHFKDCDLVVEAVLEELSLKHRVMQQMEEVLPNDAVLATNTSAIPIRDIAAGCRRPENVLGMHYFSPVDKMMLLEIITHEGTSKEAAAKAVDLGIKQGKTVIVCKDVPGFYVNRSLGPYMCEVMALLQAGVPAGTLEKAMKASDDLLMGAQEEEDDDGAALPPRCHFRPAARLSPPRLFLPRRRAPGCA